MKIKNWNEAITKLQGSLIPYLNSKGIQTEKNFSCFNPKHKDKTPSMGVVRPDNKRVYCHGCGWKGDLFDCYNILENKPLSGQGFVSETLMILSKQFGVEIETSELTEDEIYELDTYRAYKYAAEFIQNWPNEIPDDVSKELSRRGWPTDGAGREKLQHLGVGFITDAKIFREYLKTLGFTAKFLNDVDLDRTDIFSPGHLIFTIRDEAGRPVGFGARDLNWVKGEGPKYVNQKTTGVKCNIYQKSKRLYSLDVALRDSGAVYIFEGYSDVITANLNGVANCVAACGTSFTADHLSSLKENKRYDLILCLDGDEAGQTKTAELLDKRFGGQRDVNLRIVNLPDGLDPDDFIRAHGIDAFMNLRRWTAFEWRLERFPEDSDSEVVATTMMPLIVNESSHIKQSTMLETLARHTGYPLKTLTSELSRLLNEKERDKDNERKNVLERLSREMIKSPDDAEVLMTEAKSKLQAVRSKYHEDRLSEFSTLEMIDGYKNREESYDGSFQGFVLGDDLYDFQQALAGDWKKDVFLAFGGKANSGKSSFLSKLAVSIAQHEEENNAIVIYHSIDDTMEQLLPKFICIAEGSTQLEINQVKDPNYWSKHLNDPDVFHRRATGYDSIRELIKRGRLVLKDMNDGQSLAFAENLIRYYQEKYPGRNVVYILDNLHKLKDFGDTGGDERIRFKKISSSVKELACRLHVCAISTIEYTKLPAGTRPTNDNIAETVQLEYDANLIVHLFNPLHEFGDLKADETMYHMSMSSSEGLKKMPIVDMNIGKNKISAFKSRLYWNFHPASSDFKPRAAESIEQAQDNLRKGKDKEQTPALFRRRIGKVD